MNPIRGLHHVTAMARDPQVNLDFYHRVLGQRLVKRTINFDDPGTYHFYFADETGTPGSVLTFFPWPMVKRGTPGNGEAAAVAYAIPPEAADFWRERLAASGVVIGETSARFGDPVIPFRDPDGMAVELVVTESAGQIQPWTDGLVPVEFALRGFHSVTLWLADSERTAELLSGVMGYRFMGVEGQRARYAAPGGAVGAVVDLLQRPGLPGGRFGGGSIHHVAFRAADEEEQSAYQAALRAAGFSVTPVRDRQYFRSIYFRTPGGVLFEIATDGPGFLIDESATELGRSLRLPPWQEPQRAEIEAVLPRVHLPELTS